MSEIKISGFNSVGVSEEIELPGLYNLMNMQWVKKMNAEDVYKHGGELNRYLLSKTPITHSRKYAIVDSLLYCLPADTSNLHISSWHLDSPNNINHIMIGKGKDLCKTSPLSFIKDDINLEIEDGINKEQFGKVIENKVNNGLETVEAELGKIVTFNGSNLKKISPAKKLEFRFVWRVIESDDITPDNLKDALKDRSRMLYTGVADSVLSIEKIPRGIVMRGIS